MGNQSTKDSSARKYKASNESRQGPPKFQTFRDKYETIEQIQEALQKCGLESSNLIIGIDYTISNVSAGKNTFFGRSLHAIDQTFPNPYQQVISIIGRTLEVFDDDKWIPAFGFGDQTTKDKAVFSFFPDGRPCNRFLEVLSRYNEITPHVKLGGPTSFAPIIREALKIVSQTRSYHILIICADGQVTPDSEYCRAMSETREAIVEASNYPLSIVVVGVGDGPWEDMHEFDDGLPQRRFDNFQFVEMYSTMNSGPEQFRDVNFAMNALMEIPDQYQAIKALRYL